MHRQLRQALVADAAALASMHAASWREAYHGLLPADYLASLDEGRLARGWRARLRAPGRVWLLEDASHGVVGFSLIGAGRDDDDDPGFMGEIFMLYLEPRFIGCGLGSELFRRSVEVLSRRGHRWLVAWVLASNASARSFYERRGMRTDGSRRRDRFCGRTVAVVRYAKPLNPVVDFDEMLGTKIR